MIFAIVYLLIGVAVAARVVAEYLAEVRRYRAMCEPVRAYWYEAAVAVVVTVVLWPVMVVMWMGRRWR